MPPVWIGLTVAFASALVTNTAYSLEHDAAAALPPLSPRRPFRSAKLLLGDRRWLTAFAAETAGWLMYVAALRLAPLSLVQAVAASGVAVLAFATARGHPSRLAWREQFAVVLALAGLMLLALSLVDTTESDQRPGAVGVIIWLAACGGGAALIVAIPTRFGRAASLGLAAGLLFADGDISAKLSGYGGPWLVAIAALIVAYATGTTVLQSAYQRGDALTAAGTATMVTNAVPIAAGFVLFGETLPHGMRAVLQIAAFACLVVSAVALGHQQSPQAGQPASRADRGSIRPRGSTMDQASARNTARDARATGTAGEPAAVSPDRPTGRELLGEIWSVAQDLPLFLTAPLYRSWHLRWGATPAEAAAPMPGDALVPGAQYRSTRAITISAPTTQVWPWLVQVGCLRAGFYSNDLLDNLARPSARTIVPALQHLEVGQLVPMSPSAAAPERTAFRVHSFQEGEWLLWSKSDSTWAWSLRPTDRGGTRLVTRIRARYDWRHPLAALVALLLMEAGDFAMLRRMLRGIRSRAESHSDGSRTAKGPDALTQA